MQMNALPGTYKEARENLRNAELHSDWSASIPAKRKVFQPRCFKEGFKFKKAKKKAPLIESSSSAESTEEECIPTIVKEYQR